LPVAACHSPPTNHRLLPPLHHCPPQARPGGGERRTAGLPIIGDEILSAKVEDVNTRFLCSELRSIGWTVEKVGWDEGQGWLCRA